MGELISTKAVMLHKKKMDSATVSAATHRRSII